MIKAGTLSRSSIVSLPHDAPIDDIHRTLCEDGTVIIEDLLDLHAVESLNRELGPLLQGPQLGLQDDLVVGRTRRLNATLQHSPTMVDQVVAHPVLVESAEATLSAYCDTIQIGVSTATEIVPGEVAQMLHRDDWNWGHIQGRSHPLSIFSIIALSEFTEMNGATRVIPGSHLWEDAYQGSSRKESWRNGIYEEISFPLGMYDDLAIPAVLRPGSAVMALGTTVHGAGANTTADVHRRCVQMKYCMGWLRTTVNNYLLFPPEFARTLPEPVQRLLGYQLEARHLGMLEQGVDPIEILRQ